MIAVGCMGSHVAVNFGCDKCGWRRPQPIIANCTPVACSMAELEGWKLPGNGRAYCPACDFP